MEGVLAVVPESFGEGAGEEHRFPHREDPRYCGALGRGLFPTKSLANALGYARRAGLWAGQHGSLSRQAYR